MAIKISGTTVIDDSRNVTDVENVGDANTVYYGSGANLTGVQAGSTTLTASGAISNGDAVLINSNGTVSVVAATAANPPTKGTEVVFNENGDRYYAGVFDPTTGKVVIAYQSSSSGKAQVGTVSGTSISFGSAVTFDSTDSESYSIAYDSTNEKVVIAYKRNNGNKPGYAIVGTVSGTSISFGSATEYRDDDTREVSIAYDSTNEKVVIAYQLANQSGSPYTYYGEVKVGTVSGTSLSFGSQVVFNNTGSTSDPSVVFDPNTDKIVLAYRDGGNSSYGTVKIGTVSGNSISFGSAVVFESASAVGINAVYDTSNKKVVIAYRDNGNSSQGTAIVGTVSGNSISFGSAVIFDSSSVTVHSAVFDSLTSKVAINYKDGGNNEYGTIIAGTVSGTSISFGTPLVYKTYTIEDSTAVYDSTNDKVVVVYKDGSNSNYGTAVVVTTGTTNLTAENFIGFAGEAISNGATGSITIAGGTNSSQSGLSTAKKYYVQADGTLDTAADNPSVVAGTSISSTGIVVRTRA